MQSKKSCLCEATISAIAGYCIVFGVQLYIFPFFGVIVSVTQNFTLSFIFTALAILKNYIIRRVFNKKTYKMY